MKIDTDKVKARMLLRYINGKQLAEKMGISSRSVYRVLRGETQFRPENLRKLCEILECEPLDIMKERR